MAGDRGPATSAVTLIMIIIATVFVAARFFTRVVLLKSVKQDDWWLLAAWFMAVGVSASICVGVHYGLGHHTKAVENHVALRKTEYAFSVLYNPALMFTKTSIIIFFISVMSKDVDPIFKWCNWLTLAVTNLAGLALTFLNIFQCHPISATFLYPTPNNVNCIDIVTLYLSSAPVNIITDLAILFLPMPILTGLRLPKKQKIILVVTFGLGAFITAVDVIRIAYLQNASLNRLKTEHGDLVGGSRANEQDDFSWYASLSFMWSGVEVNLGVIIACVPSLKPLFLRFMPTFVRDTSDDNSPKATMNMPGPDGTANGMAMKGNISTLNNPAAFRKPTVADYAGDDDGDAMGFLNMLAGPDEDAPGVQSQSKKKKNSKATLTRTNTATSMATSDFDFFHMDSTKNMLKLSNTQSLWPIGVVTVIFFLWGFAYGLLASLNSKFASVANISEAQSLGLHASYFAAYAVGPLTLGQFFLRKYGFRATMMAGLCVYGCGTLIFWPSAVLTSYAAFVISNFIVAFGLSCLEVAANPFIAMCGPLEYAEVRLNFSQGVQAIGTILSPLLAQKALFTSGQATALVDVQWAYLAIALFVIGLAVVFYYIPLPEATDEQLQAMADRRTAAYSAKVGPYRVVWVTLALGVFSQWCYVGSQEAIGGSSQALYTLIRGNKPRLTPFDFQTVGHTVFMFGRFASAILNYVFTPRWILFFLYTGLVITCGLQMTLSGTGALVNNQLIYLFESGAFSIIYAITLRGMGEHTKWAAAWMTAAISGGAIPTVIQWAAANGHGQKFSFIVPLIFFFAGWLFPLYLNTVPAARNQVDPTHENRNMRREARKQRKATRTNSDITEATTETREFGLRGILARRKRAKAREAKEGQVQHVEQSGGRGSITSDLQSPVTPSTMNEKDFDLGGAESSVVQMRRPSGTVGELAAWPGTEEKETNAFGTISLDDDSSNSSDKENRRGGNEKGEKSSSSDEDVITRHRPQWEENDEEDDYHMFLRGK